MNARSRALLDELRSLPLDEREAVVAELYTDVAGQPPAYEPGWLAELERRTRASQAGQTTSISEEEMDAKVEAALRK